MKSLIFRLVLIIAGICAITSLFSQSQGKEIADDDTTGIRAAYIAATGFRGRMILYPSLSILNGSLPGLNFTTESDTAYMHTLADSIVYGYLPYIGIPAEQVKFSKLIIYKPYWYPSADHFFFKYEQVINGIKSPGYIYIDFENNKPYVHPFTGKVAYPTGPRFDMSERLLRTADMSKDIKVTREQALDMMHNVRMPALNDSIGTLCAPYPVSINLQYGCQLYCHWLDKRPWDKRDNVNPDKTIRLFWHMRWKGYLMDVDAVTGEVINSMSYLRDTIPTRPLPKKLVITPEQAVDSVLVYDRNYNTLMDTILTEHISTVRMRYNGEFYWEANSPFSYITEVDAYTGKVISHYSGVSVN